MAYNLIALPYDQLSYNNVPYINIIFRSVIGHYENNKVALCLLVYDATHVYDRRGFASFIIYSI